MRSKSIIEPIAGTTVGSLPTSRHAPQQERAVLAVLRGKAPRRALAVPEAEQVAEWQATALLGLAGLTEPPTPSALITELPRVLVRADVDLPVSGCAQWRTGRWLILINGSEPYGRQRFSMAHEYKHTVDHRYQDVMYVDRPRLTAAAQAEHAADFFAACLLMPRGWVKRAWGEGYQRLSELAELFQVSPPAMARRLQHLGLRPLAGQEDQCTNGEPHRSVYNRTSQSLPGVAV